MRDFKEGLYEVTITLQPHLYKFNIKEQVTIFNKNYTHIFHGMDHTTVLELTNDLNVHSHSLVSVNSLEEYNNMIMRYKASRKIFGRWEHLPVRDVAKYIKYMAKDIFYMFKTYDIISISKDKLRLFNDLILHYDVNIEDYKTNPLTVITKDTIQKYNIDISIHEEDALGGLM